MRLQLATLAAALFVLAGCNNEGRSVGNGPGQADGAGNTTDPANAPQQNSPQEAGTNASSESASPNMPSEPAPSSEAGSSEPRP